MAEQFLEEIYADAKVIDNLYETIAFIARTDYYNARISFNSAMDRLEILLGEYAKEDAKAANELQDCALDIIDKWGNWSYMSGKIRGTLIPQVYKYMALSATIDVEEGNYEIKSSDSGFLTVKDVSTNMFLHDIHDPMQEAGDIADMLYRPWTEKYILYGCGLGYLAYKLWKKSGEAAKIVIYEDDETLLDYARHYGVLDWIDEDALEIISIPDPLKTIEVFSKEVDFRDKTKVCYVTQYKKNKYRLAHDGKFLALVYNIEYFWISYGVNETNLWKNKKLESTAFPELKRKLASENWIVVAAGPSLNYSMDLMDLNQLYPIPY